MHRKQLTWSVIVLAAAGSMWACGSDDDGAPGGSGGASAGAGGHSAGSAGKAQGGGAGKAQGGGSNGGGGNAGKGGGTEVAGAAGENVGGDSAGGAAGDSAGGVGGDAAGGSAGDSSAAGAAGAPSAPTLEENCTAVCAAQSTLTCSFGVNCVTACEVTATDPDFPTNDIPGYEKMIACEAKNLTTVSSYECSEQGGPIWPAPKNNTTCNASICAWACADMSGAADPNVVARCACP